MTDRFTRRAALGLLLCGGGLIASETGGVTNLSANRDAAVDVVGDGEGYLGIEGLINHIAPIDAECINRFDDEIDVEIGSNAGFTVEPDSFSLDAGSGQLVEIGTSDDDEDSAEGELDVEATTTANETLALSRFLRLEGYEDEAAELRLWLDAEDDDRFEFRSEEEFVRTWQDKGTPRTNVTQEELDWQPRRTDGRISSGRWALEFSSDGGLSHPRFLSRQEGDIDLESDATGPRLSLFLVPQIRGEGYVVAFRTGGDEIRLEAEGDANSVDDVTALIRMDGEDAHRRLSYGVSDDTRRLLEFHARADGDDTTFEAIENGARADLTTEPDSELPKASLNGGYDVGIGATPDGSAAFRGDIGELLVYRGYLGSGIETTRESLAEKWGISLS